MRPRRTKFAGSTAKGSLLAMEGGVKTLFRDPPETMLDWPRFNSLLSIGKFPVNSRREITRKALICHVDSGRLGSA